jgi:hypothetical protein
MPLLMENVYLPRNARNTCMINVHSSYMEIAFTANAKKENIASRKIFVKLLHIAQEPECRDLKTILLTSNFTS